MGAKTGKLAFHHSDQGAAETVVATDAVQANTSAHVNGEASNLQDVPLIDGPPEPGKEECSTADDTTAAGGKHGQNGTTVASATAPTDETAQADEHTAELAGKETHKKRTNPIVWIQRRVSKKLSSITKKKSSIPTEDTEPKEADSSEVKPVDGDSREKPSEGDQPESTVKTEDQQPPVAEDEAKIQKDESKLESVADEIVQDTLATCESAVSQEPAPVVPDDEAPKQDPVAETPAASVEEQTAEAIEEQPPSEVIVNGNHTDEAHHEVVDINNTSSAVNEPAHDEEQHQLSEKLAACNVPEESPAVETSEQMEHHDQA